MRPLQTTTTDLRFKKNGHQKIHLRRSERKNDFESQTRPN